MPEETYRPEDDFGDMFGQDDPSSQDEVETQELGDDAFEGEGVEEGGESNRTFLIAAGVLGALLLLSLCAIGSWAMFIRPRQAAERNAQATAIMLTNTALAATMTQAAQSTAAAEATAAAQATATTAPQEQATPTPAFTATPVPPTVTPTTLPPTATPTPVVFQPTATPVGGQDAQAAATPTPLINPAAIAATATAIAAAAQATQQAQATATLPDTGLGDGLWGSPLGLLTVAVLLIAVIVVARRVRRA